VIFAVIVTASLLFGWFGVCVTCRICGAALVAYVEFRAPGVGPAPPPAPVVASSRASKYASELWLIVVL
jgi:hypothetical protein